MIKITASSARKKSKYPSEAAEQKAAWSWLATVTTMVTAQTLTTLQDYSYHIPNGAQLSGTGRRRAVQMASLKAQGLRPGVSDICIAYPVWQGPSCYHGAYIELKRVKGAYKGPAAVKAAVREEQKNWLRLMDSVGYWVAVAYGAHEFRELVTSYLRGENRPPLDFLDR